MSTGVFNPFIEARNLSVYLSVSLLHSTRTGHQIDFKLGTCAAKTQGCACALLV